MKGTKWFIPLLIIAGITMCLVAIRFTGIVRIFRVASGANDPALVSGSSICTTSLGTPVRMDFVSFPAPDGPYFKPGIWIMRLVGMPGDRIEMRNGVLYANGKNLDEGLHLKQEYIVSKNELLKISPDFYKTHDAEIIPATGDSADVTLEADLFQSKNIAGRQVMTDNTDSQIFEIFHQPWTRDRFGPVTVPADCYFLMGDNRHGAADSRYIGFIEKKKILGTVFYGQRKFSASK